MASGLRMCALGSLTHVLANPSSHRCLCTMALKASPSLQLVVKLCTLTLGYLQTDREKWQVGLSPGLGCKEFQVGTPEPVLPLLHVSVQLALHCHTPRASSPCGLHLAPEQQGILG